MATLPEMTLAELRTAAQQRADMVGSSYVSDAEWTSLLNESYFELYDLLIGTFEDYAVSTHDFTTDGTSDTYALPSDFYKLLGVDLKLSSDPNGCVSLRPFAFAERNRYAPNAQSIRGRTNLQYRLRGSTVWLVPCAAAGQTVRLYYAPRLTPLAAESDTADGVSGWLEYVVVDAARKALVKEESDTSALDREKAALTKRIEAIAQNRDAGAPATVADTRYLNGGWPSPYGDDWGA